MTKQLMLNNNKTKQFPKVFNFRTTENRRWIYTPKHGRKVVASFEQKHLEKKSKGFKLSKIPSLNLKEEVSNIYFPSILRTLPTFSVSVLTRLKYCISCFIPKRMRDAHLEYNVIFLIQKFKDYSSWYWEQD